LEKIAFFLNLRTPMLYIPPLMPEAPMPKISCRSISALSRSTSWPRPAPLMRV